MYLTVHRKPSQEEIVLFKMKVTEEDANVDYQVEITSLDQTTKKTFCESFNIKPESIEGITKVALSHHNEI